MTENEHQTTQPKAEERRVSSADIRKVIIDAMNSKKAVPGKSSAALRSFEDKLDLGQLRELKAVFNNDQLDGGKDLDEGEFVDSFGAVLGDSMDVDVLREWFMCIDANANGSVDWNEFSTYILLEAQQRILKDTVQTEYIIQHFPSAKKKDDHHRDMIGLILVHPRNSKYYSFSRDGTIKVWRSRDMESERILYNGGSLITDACFMKGAHRLMVCCADRKICVLDSNTGDLVRAFAGRKHVRDEIRESMCLRQLNDKRKYGVALDMEKAWGEALSSSVCYKTECGDQTFGEFKHSMEQSQRERVKKKRVEITTLRDFTEAPTALEYFTSESGQESILLGLRNGSMQLYHLSNALSGMRAVLDVAYTYPIHAANKMNTSSDCAISKIKLSQYLQGAITGSWDGMVKITNLDTGHVVRNFHGHQKSVFALDWSESLKIIATCGTERSVLIWNPFINKPVFKLQGHNASLVNVAINDKDFQVITLSADKCIKVWDVRTFRCMQTLCDNTHYQSESKYFALAYDPVRHSIVTGSTFPIAWPMRKISAKFPATYMGHTKPCVDLLISYFGHVVSADAEMVMAWDLETGQRISAFNASRIMPDAQSRITAVTLDETGRRLLTGTHTGQLMMWNYLNGQPLNQYNSELSQANRTKTEVTAVSHCGGDKEDQRYIVGALGKSLHIYPDEEKYNIKIVSEFVTDSSDILCVQKLGRYVVLGLEDGKIFMYNPQTNIVEGRCLHWRTSPIASDRLQQVITRLHRASSHRIECLAKLPDKSSHLLVSSTSDGFLEFWDTKGRRLLHIHRVITHSNSRSKSHHQLNKLSSISNIYRSDSVDQIICRMTSDQDNSILILGSDCGLVTVLDLTQMTIPVCENSFADGLALVSSFQAHTSNITAVNWITWCSAILTASADCSVKLYTKSGACVGVFGMNTWDINDMSTWKDPSPNQVHHEVKHLNSVFLVTDKATESSKGTPSRLNRSPKKNKRTSILQMPQQPIEDPIGMDSRLSSHFRSPKYKRTVSIKKSHTVEDVLQHRLQSPEESAPQEPVIPHLDLADISSESRTPFMKASDSNTFRCSAFKPNRECRRILRSNMGVPATNEVFGTAGGSLDPRRGTLGHQRGILKFRPEVQTSRVSIVSDRLPNVLDILDGTEFTPSVSVPNSCRHNDESNDQFQGSWLRSEELSRPQPKAVGMTLEQLDVRIAKLHNSGYYKPSDSSRRGKRQRKEELLTKRQKEVPTRRPQTTKGVWENLPCLSPTIAKPPSTINNQNTAPRPDSKRWRSCQVCQEWEQREEKRERMRAKGAASAGSQNLHTLIRWTNNELHDGTW